MAVTHARRMVLPGFGLTMGYMVLYLSLLVLIPLSGVFWRAAAGGWRQFWSTVTDARAVAAYRLSFGGALLAAAVATACGLLVGWVLVRYRFPGRGIIDAFVDLPFALPTAVAGIALTTIYAQTGWLGRPLAQLGINVAFTPLGVIVAMTFVGLPFAIRSVQPVLESLDAEDEDAASSLGASRWQTFMRVILPALRPALVTGFTLAFARAVGEYGSVIFIAGNMPMRTEIAPLLIVTKLEQFNYVGAAAVAVAMLVVSLVVLMVINITQWRRSHPD